MVTQVFPFGIGEEFIHEELRFCDRRMGVVLFPQRLPELHEKARTADNWDHALTDDVHPLEVIRIIASKAGLKILLSGLEDSFRRGNRFTAVLALKRYIKACIRAAQFKRIADGNPGFRVIYTYWFDDAANGAIIFKKVFAWNGTVMVKVHGTDLYRERNPHGFIPLRRALAKAVDSIVFEGEFSRNYLATEYLEKGFIEDGPSLLISPLGVSATPFTTSPRDDNILSILTVAHLNPVKDFGLAFKVLKKTIQDKRLDGMSILWTLIGDGPEANFVQKEASVLERESGGRVKVEMLGYMDNQMVKEHYRSNSIDLYLCTSILEGSCYAILEALSYGVPVCSASVGEIGYYLDAQIGYCVERDDIRSFVDSIASYEHYRSQAFRQRCVDYIYSERDSRKVYPEWWSIVDKVANS